MARNVNVWFEGWNWTGSNVQTPQAELHMRIEWIDGAGERQSTEEDVLFPNILGDVPQAWVKEELQDLMLRALRKKAGVDA
jgi:hypothetical protein